MVRVAQQGRGIFISDCAKKTHRPGGDRVSRFQRLYMLGLGIGLVCALLHSPQALSQITLEWVATLKSVEGTVEARRAAQNEWSPAALNDTFTIGDSIRVLAYGRAAILLPDETILRLDQNTTVTFTEPQDETRSWLELLRGAIHIISRDPRALKVITPFAGAGLEGTEFLIEVTRDETIVTVYEGEVSVSTDSGDVNVTPGQRVTARTGQQPLAQVVASPRDAVQWTLYYAPIFDDQVPAADSEAQADQAEDPLFYTGRASNRLAVGRVNEARDDIAQALNLDPTNVDALALQSIIAVAQNDLDSAFARANRALAQDSDSAAAMIALSYAQQAILDISGALITMQSVVERHPSNGLGWARLSELWLAVGDLNQSLIAAQTAVDLNSNVARAQTVLGFAYLAQIEIPQAIDAFNDAINLDQAAPLPRLGLGLALIRAGDLEAGRAEIEIAVILDPGNALIRSYMGKAYYEEKRDELAESQLNIAKVLDPLDPTPWFYDAIRKQTINRSVEALHDLQKSVELNDNRAVYRSSLLLDGDLAARSANLGRIYRDLGFEQLALVEGWKSVNTDPSDYSGHRFLADSYAALPRHETTRVSELLKAQLLQPINIAPLQPQQSESNLAILEGAGPSDPSFNEFNPMFVRNQIAVQVNGIVASNDTSGEDLVLSGIHDRISYSVGQFHYETDGFRENNDLKHDIYNVFAQVNLSSSSSIQFEARSKETEFGDIEQNFDLGDFSPADRRDIDNDQVRFGFHNSLTPSSDLLVSVMHGDLVDKQHREVMAAPFLVIFDDKADLEGDFGELQYIKRSRAWSLTAGGGVFRQEGSQTVESEAIGPFPLPPEPPTTIDRDVDHDNAYVYSILRPTTNTAWTLGVSYDDFESANISRDQFNPKVGVIWNVTDSTTLRFAAFKVLKRSLVSNQTLEPTQIAGFTQFFDDLVGTEVERYGIGVDQAFSETVFGGLESSARDLEIPRVDRPDANNKVDEQVHRAYIYWTPSSRLALSAEYQFDRFDQKRVRPFTVNELRSHMLPIRLTLYPTRRFFVRASVTYVRQEVEIAQLPLSANILTEDEDTFSITDISVGYRLPKRRGILSVGVNNVFDKDFKFQDRNFQTVGVLTPLFLPERTVFGRFTLRF